MTAVRACRICGCTDLNACPGGCSWVGKDLCSSCAPNAMPMRDPRTDPQPFDTVTVAGETREVEKVIGDRVIYSWPGKVAVRTLSLSQWRAWAAKASAFTALHAHAEQPAQVAP